MRFTIAALLALACTTAALAAPKPSALFTDHTVLQRGMAVPVWGAADPGEKITVSIAGVSGGATADDKGAWMVKLSPLPGGGPYEMTIAGKTTVVVKDVLVGEVWLCSGQSNMAMLVPGALNAEQEQAAGDYPNLRMITVAANGADEPQHDIKGNWVAATPKTVGRFSATAYFFGREIHKETGVPVGLINSSVGGTPIEAWISMSAQQAQPALAPVFAKHQRLLADWDSGKTKAEFDKAVAAWEQRNAALKKAGKPLVDKPKEPRHPGQGTGRPANLFNGKIAPLIPYAIRGAIWYQGESNANELASLYQYQLPTLIGDWRGRWGEGTFPFYWVQLPNIGKPQVAPIEETAWALVQDGMRRTLAVPHTGMAITTDVGDPHNVHPKDKQSVGRRLARLALHDVYGKTALVRSGPLFAGLAERGRQVVINFDNADGLKTRDGSADIKGFALADSDQKWRWAPATLKGGSVILETEGKPVTAVRYNWASNPAGTLENSSGLPASPFRTDDWPSSATRR